MAAPIALVALGLLHPFGDDGLDFARDVRPILSDKCFACHGPDPATREAGLRLDTPDGAFSPTRSGARAVVPGEPDESELVYRIRTEFEAERMPPIGDAKDLTEAERQTLLRWVQEGAAWGEHWSFEAPECTTPPALDVAPIDAFVGARLAEADLALAPEAPPATLLRRVTLDLTGLPPTPEERSAFEAECRQGGIDAAYARAVDRLLASPRYGVHMARTWLDAARYGDTHGLHLDNRRSMWPYRDWVVRALNENVPFDRFTRMQLAGDLLPDADQDDLIASGFNRCNPSSAEGGMIEQEYLSIYAKDRVDTTTTVWLGLTLACAQCHDHKFDPLTQRDYYGMAAFFHGLEEKASDENIENPAPFIRVADEATRAELAALEDEERALNEVVDAPRPELDAREAEWLGQARADGRRWGALVPEAVSGSGGETMEVDRATGVVSVSGANPATTVYEVDAWVPPGAFQDLRLDALVPEGQKLPGRADNQNFVLTSVEVLVAPGESDARTAVPVTTAVATFDQNGWAIDGVLDPAKDKGWAGLGRDGDRSGFLRLARPVVGDERGTELRVRLFFESPYAKHALARFRLAVHREGQAPARPAPLALELALAPEYATGLADGAELPQRVRDAVRLAFRREHAPAWASAYERRASVREDLRARQSMLPTTLVSRERAEPRPAHILVRGAYDQLGEEVEPDTPAALPPFPADAPRNRLGLADWILAPENPLTARVWVNRAWQHFFGRGIVATPEDLGAQGKWPSHPELLDWLALEFVEGGWDQKAMHRAIVLSRTYRQSSDFEPERVALDPDNVLLSRGPRHRLDGEVLRDSALFVAGLLDETTGGPGVRPYQPDGVWFAVGYTRSNTVRYTQGDLDHLHRRSLYTFWKRTAPPPNLTTFDAPMRDACVVRRERTNTPLQALVTLNDPTYVEAARFLAARELAVEGPVDEIAARVLERVLGRAPEAHEVATLAALARDLERMYAEAPADAEALLAVGDLPSSTMAGGDLDPVRLAAWTLVASAALNLDETLSKN